MTDFATIFSIAVRGIRAAIAAKLASTNRHQCAPASPRVFCSYPRAVVDNGDADMMASFTDGLAKQFQQFDDILHRFHLVAGTPHGFLLNGGICLIIKDLSSAARSHGVSESWFAPSAQQSGTVASPTLMAAAPGMVHAHVGEFDRNQTQDLYVPEVAHEFCESDVCTLAWDKRTSLSLGGSFSDQVPQGVSPQDSAGFAVNSWSFVTSFLHDRRMRYLQREQLEIVDQWERMVERRKALSELGQRQMLLHLHGHFESFRESHKALAEHFGLLSDSSDVRPAEASLGGGVSPHWIAAMASMQGATSAFGANAVRDIEAAVQRTALRGGFGPALVTPLAASPPAFSSTRNHINAYPSCHSGLHSDSSRKHGQKSSIHGDVKPQLGDVGPIELSEEATAFSGLVSTDILIEDIQRCVARYYGIRVSDLIARRGSPAASRSIKVAIFLANVMTPQSLTQIGHGFGGRSHAFVAGSIRWVAELSSVDKEFAAELHDLISQFRAQPANRLRLKGEVDTPRTDGDRGLVPIRELFLWPSEINW